MAWNSTNFRASNWFDGNWQLGPGGTVFTADYGVHRLGLQLGLLYRPYQV
jgi:hypothetical protein